MRDNTGIFDIVSHTVVARGNGLIPRDNIERIYKDSLEELRLEGQLHNMMQQMQQYSELLVPHRDFLSHLGANFEKAK